MKNLIYALLFVLLVSSVSVCAAASFTANDLTFGSDSMVRGQDDTQTLTITNTGDTALTVTLASKMSTVYNARIVPATVTVAPGATATAAVTINVPLSQSSAKTKITGGILASAAAGNLTTTVNTYAIAESMLEISKVAVILDDGSSEKTFASDERFDKLKAGSSFTLRVYVKNMFTDSDNIDINDVEVTVLSDDTLGIDDSQNLDDDSLNPGHKSSADFTADVPTDAEDGDSYDVDITAKGQDENNAWHYASFSGRMEVNRVTNEVTISQERISPSSISCNGKVTITADLTNTGSANQDSAFLLIENDQLDIMEKFYATTLDRDDTVTKTYSFNIDNKTAPGNYDLMLTSFYGSDKQSDAKVVTLTVNPCQATVTTPTTPTVVNPINTQPVMPEVVPTNGATPVYGTASFTDSPVYLIVLVAAVVIVLLILIILLVKFVF